MDCVASLYGRNHLGDIVRSAAKDIFVPMTAGGGIRSVDDATQILRAGADKVAVNTAAVANPQLITEIARRLVVSAWCSQSRPSKSPLIVGRSTQIMAVSAPAGCHRVGDAWRIYGRRRSIADIGGSRGTRKGFDIALVKAVTEEVSVPVIASGGMGKPEDLIDIVQQGGADAVAMADILHYNRAIVGDIRRVARTAGLG